MKNFCCCRDDGADALQGPHECKNGHEQGVKNNICLNCIVY